jgi:hypothetical protein
MRKPTLYVALEGPLLVPSNRPHEYLGAGVADYAKNFLNWAKDRFQVQVFTDKSPRHVFVLADHLGLPGDAIAPRGYEAAKTDVMQPTDDFYWVDSELIPSEIAWLAKHNNYTRFLSVDPTVGVTPRHKDALEGLTRNSRRN